MKTKLITIIFQLFILGLGCQAQTIKGVVIDQKGDTTAFANIAILDGGQTVLTTTSDLNGEFIIKQDLDLKNKRLFANLGKCSSDTITLTENNSKNLRVVIPINKNCRPE